jgi:hypothetical protein
MAIIQKAKARRQGVVVDTTAEESIEAAVDAPIEVA